MAGQRAATVFGLRGPLRASRRTARGERDTPTGGRVG